MPYIVNQLIIFTNDHIDLVTDVHAQICYHIHVSLL